MNKPEKEIFSSNLSLLIILVSVVFSFIILKIIFQGKDIDFANAGNMGALTTSVYASKDSFSIHCTGNGGPIEECLEGSKRRNKDLNVVWFGNSQLYSVNLPERRENIARDVRLDVSDKNIKDINAIPVLFNNLETKDIDLVAFAEENANPQEHYVIFEFVRKFLNPELVILPLVFDDFREANIRDHLLVYLEDFDTQEALLKSAIGAELISKNSSKGIDSNSIDTAGIKGSIQQDVENAINSWLIKKSDLWEVRPEMRGTLISKLYAFRNFIFRVNSQTKRKMLPAAYADNIKAVHALLKSAKEEDMTVLVYIAPFITELENPYITEEYQNFKKEAEEIVGLYSNSYFYNLENLVPLSDWGVQESIDFTEDSQIDFMHFKTEGHRLLAKEIFLMIETSLDS